MTQEKPLIASFSIRATDLRSTLGIAPSTFHDFLKRVGIEPATQKRGRGAAFEISGTDARKILELRGYQYPNQAKVICFMMCKGGVGKTTSSFFLGQRLSAYGAKVLLIDADTQGNLTSAFSLEDCNYTIDEGTAVLVHIVTGEHTTEQAIIPVTPNLHLIPSSPMNANLDVRIRESGNKSNVPIRKIITPLRKQYDYILIDCAPALDVTNASVICASDLVILPVTPDRFSQIGMEQTIAATHQIEQDFNFSVEQNILFTKYSASRVNDLKYLSYIIDKYSDYRFPVAIRDCNDVRDALTNKQNLFTYPKSDAKEDYDAFAQEIMNLKDLSSKRTSKSSEIRRN